MDAAKTNGHAVALSEGVRSVEPIGITEFRNDSRLLTIDWNGQEIRFAYKPSAMDADHYKALRDEDNMPMSEWDISYGLRIIAAIPSICEDDGSLFEITEANLRKLPTAMLNRMVSAIGDDILPKAPTASASSEPSPPAVPKVASPGGTSRSKRRSTSASRRGS